MAHGLFGNLRVGKPRAWHKSGVCARVDDWTRKLEDPSDYSVAKCKEGATIDNTIATVTPPATSQGQFSSDAGAHMPWSKVDLMPMDGGIDRAVARCTPVQPLDCTES
ncbi:Gp1ba [Symbiodinium natans]|uniref:Gp1ba protein n=1 Tax=Symbiodinium natans TaxID=878477 RepID=A0A812K9F6_9DINO|nr:Gp1ba [Symbiodinium natans]